MDIRIEKNFNRLSTAPYDEANLFSPPEYDWPGDWEGRALLAYCRLYSLTGKKVPAMEKIMGQLDEKTNAYGYFGKKLDLNAVDEQQLSGHGWFLRGLMAYYELFHSQQAMEYAHRIVHNLFLPALNTYGTYPVKRDGNGGGVYGNLSVKSENWQLSTDIGCAFIPIDGLAHYYAITQDEKLEETIWLWTEKHPIASCRLQLIRCLISNASAPQSIDKLYQLWEKQSHPMLNERDYMTMAYELALYNPEKYENILTTQRNRITNPDRLRQFDFISQAVTPDTLQMDAFFQSLLKAENRRIEPWAASALAYLNHPLREKYAVKYIRPGLEVLQEVQRTGDIFFPKNWVSALLRNHKSKEAYQEVQAFFKAHPGYSPLLTNKILQAAWPLYKEAANSLDM